MARFVNRLTGVCYGRYLVADDRVIKRYLLCWRLRGSETPRESRSAIGMTDASATRGSMRNNKNKCGRRRETSLHSPSVRRRGLRPVIRASDDERRPGNTLDLSLLRSRGSR